MNPYEKTNTKRPSFISLVLKYVDKLDVGRYLDYNENSELHYHDFFEIFLVLSNDVVHIINGQKEAIPRGTLVFIRKNDVHCFEYSTSKEPSFVNLIFKEDVTRKLFEYLSDDFQLDILLTQPNPPSLLVTESDITWILKQLPGFKSILQIQRKLF